jgi:hypothetical protein
MGDTPISLSEMRAKKADDASLWEPLDCAKALVRDIESGKIRPRNLLVLYAEQDTDQLQTYLAKVNSLDLIAMLWGKLWRVTQAQWE